MTIKTCQALSQMCGFWSMKTGIHGISGESEGVNGCMTWRYFGPWKQAVKRIKYEHEQGAKWSFIYKEELGSLIASVLRTSKVLRYTILCCMTVIPPPPPDSRLAFALKLFKMFPAWICNHNPSYLCMLLLFPAILNFSCMMLRWVSIIHIFSH